MNDIIKYIISIFFKLFFHWSFQIREIFYFFIIFILRFKLKEKLKSKLEKKEINTETQNTENNLYFEFFLKQTKTIKKDEYFFLLDEFNENMEIIERLQKIIKKEKYGEAYMDNVIKINDIQILNKIPKEAHGNLVECLKQYNNVITKFGIWKKNIEEMNIPEENIEYPLMEISIIKDDKIQYEPI